ncbi:Fic family protein [Candidatus Latescibacterota bacterium]
MLAYESSHPWITFSINLSKAPAKLWVILGECKSICNQISGAPLHPSFQQELYRKYYAESTLNTTAMDGNTLNEDEVRDILFGNKTVPPSKKYLAQENENILRGYDLILEHIVKYDHSGLNVATINEFNQVALDRLVLDSGVAPGQVRTSDINIPSHRFKVAPAGDCPFLLEQLCTWLNSKTFDAPAGMTIEYGIIKAIIANLYLTWIHPYDKGNARTISLVEFMLLVEAGLPPVATHHFSRLYYHTKYDYFRHIENASSPGGKIVPFIMYSLQGFIEGLRDQMGIIKEHQLNTIWQNYVSEIFGDKNSIADIRRKYLVLDLSESPGPVPVSKLPELSTRLAKFYSSKTAKTLSRDIVELVSKKLLKKTPEGVSAKKESVQAFLPDNER